VSSAVLSGNDWVIPGVDRVKVCFAANNYAKEADRVWPDQRGEDHTNRHWRWQQICKKTNERFAVVGHTPAL
jgi:hypothetical protein